MCFFSNASRYSAAQRHDRGHVHLVEGGQHGRVVLRLLQPQRDRPAQAGHLYPLLPGLVLTRRPGGRARAAGAGAGRFRKSITSPLVIRPSLPVPVPTSLAETLFSAIIFAAAGNGAWTGSDAAGRETGPNGRGGGLTPAGGLAAGRGSGGGAGDRCADFGAEAAAFGQEPPRRRIHNAKHRPNLNLGAFRHARPTTARRPTAR